MNKDSDMEQLVRGDIIGRGGTNLVAIVDIRGSGGQVLSEGLDDGRVHLGSALGK